MTDLYEPQGSPAEPWLHPCKRPSAIIAWQGAALIDGVVRVLAAEGGGRPPPAPPKQNQIETIAYSTLY